jgi:hypothetical protein
MANFQIASGGMSVGKLPRNSYDEGASYITTFGVYVGHALTVVGYNDSIRIDRNGDGEYTNTVDINGDHVVDLNDYEKGALIVANTWGKSWGDNGFAYVPYHLLGRYGWEGGFWNKSVHIVDVARTVEPILTLRASFRYSCKGSIRIMAGISNDPDATEPENILEFPMFNYQGAQVPFYSSGTPDTTLFEVGLDITPLLDYVETDGPVRIFLIMDERDSWANNEGMVQSMAVYNYFNATDSTVCADSNVDIRNNSRTLMSVVRPVRFNRILIRDVPMLYVKPGEFVSLQMEASGAAEPYSWQLVPDYETTFMHAEVPDRNGKILFNGQSGELVSRVDLPFRFRFFGDEYDHFYVNEDGDLLFDTQENDYPYAIDRKLVFQSMRKIIGFNGELDYYMVGNYISWYTSDTLAAVTWKAMAPTPEGGAPVTIVCEIHPDGHIRYIYDQPEVLFPPGTTVDLGVSDGDGKQFRRVSSFNPEGLDGINCLDINPYLYPPNTKFDGTGWLFCQPDSANALYRIKVRLVDKNHRMAYSTIRISTRDLTDAPLLSGMYPNPFTDEAHFRITVAKKSQVRVDVFDLKGSLLAVLCDEELIPAEYDYVWNGACSNGTRVGPGVYICRVRVGDQMQSGKIIRTR